MANKKKVGRPLIKIDKSTFENLCAIQCTLEEIAGIFECCDDTINNWCQKTYNDNFSGVYKIYSQKGKISLRRNQLKLAEKNPTMAIWLGKQYLGQKDVIETVTNGDITINNKLADLLKIEPDEENGNG